MRTRHRPGTPIRTAQGIDRLVRNVETGRFERSLSGADRGRGAGDGGGDLLRARQGQLRQQDDVAAGRARPGRRGRRSRRRSSASGWPRPRCRSPRRRSSPTALQGTYLHARGIAQKPGGWSNARYNMEMGPPLLAPLLVTMVGGMGLLAAVLRRETVTPARRDRRHAGGRGRFPGFDVLGAGPTLGPGRPRGVVLRAARTAAATARSSPRPRRPSRAALVDQLLDQRDEPRVPVLRDDRRPAGRGADRRLALRRHARGRRRPGATRWPTSTPTRAAAVRRRLRRPAPAASRPRSSRPSRTSAATTGTACRRRTCGACGPGTPAPRSTPIPGPGTRSASPARPTRAATRTSASTRASRARSATRRPVPRPGPAERPDGRTSAVRDAQRVGLAAAQRRHPHQPPAAPGHAPVRRRRRGRPRHRRLRRGRRRCCCSGWPAPAGGSSALDAGPVLGPGHATGSATRPARTTCTGPSRG